MKAFRIHFSKGSAAPSSVRIVIPVPAVRDAPALPISESGP